MIYLEQTCHHPPRSHYLMVGPDNNYTCSGYLEMSIAAWPNSAIVTVMGYKKITFKDGMTITYNHPNDAFYNIAIGQLYHQVQGRLDFVDEKN